MERPLIAAERADQRAQAVGVGDGEVRVLGKTQHLVERVRTLRRGLQREPFVEHQRVVVEALVEGVERGLRARARRATPGCRARPGGRSYCRRRRTAPWQAPRLAARRRPPASPSATRAQPADALGARRQIVAVGAVAAGARQAARRESAVPIASRSASRAAWIASGSTISIRSAISASDRQQDRLALERRVERVGPKRGRRPHRSPAPDRPVRRARRRPATRSINSCIAS